jgi:hypothetical protein
MLPTVTESLTSSSSSSSAEVCSCALCTENYTYEYSGSGPDLRPRTCGACGQSLCTECLGHLSESIRRKPQCPFCKGSVTPAPLNHALIELLRIQGSQHRLPPLDQLYLNSTVTESVSEVIPSSSSSVSNSLQLSKLSFFSSLSPNAEVTNSSSFIISPSICGNCLQPATHFCNGCKADLCTLCVSNVHLLQVFKHHMPVPISAKYEDKSMRCHKHPDQEAIFICIFCRNMMCCLQCQRSGDHSHHSNKLILISDLVTQLKKQVSGAKIRFTKNLDELTSSLVQSRANFLLLKPSILKTKNEISHRFDQFMAKLTETRDELLKTTDGIYASSTADYDRFCESAEHCKTLLYTFIRKADDFLSTNDDHVILLSAAGFNTTRLNLKNSLRDHQDRTQQEIVCEAQLNLDSSLFDKFICSAKVKALNGCSSLLDQESSIGNTTSISSTNATLPTFITGSVSSFAPLPSIFTSRIFSVTTPPVPSSSVAFPSNSSSQSTLPSTFLAFQSPPNS